MCNYPEPLESKLNLYKVLLRKASLTPDEIDLVYILSRDKEIQAILEAKKNSPINPYKNDYTLHNSNKK